tara:strand:+ start:80 stop:466 length:387 start_codon:yes stop_codon:yes gene_type:complete
VILKKKISNISRSSKVSEIIRKALSEILIKNDLPLDPPFELPVNVTKVLMNSDLRIAYVYVLSHENNKSRELIDKLSICNKYLSKEVSKKIDLKFSPKLVFRYDESFEKVNAIEELLNSDKFTKYQRD